MRPDDPLDLDSLLGDEEQDLTLVPVGPRPVFQ